MEALGQAWLQHVQSGLDPTTRRQYGIYVSAHWVPFFGTIDRVTTPAVEDYQAARLGRVKRATLLKELAALRGFAHWAHRHGHLVERPVIETPPRGATGTADTRQPHKARPVLLDEHEVEAVLAKLPERSDGGTKGRTFAVRARFEVAWETGLRPSTLDELRAPEDYRRGASVLSLRDEIDKARYGRELPLSDRARAALDRVCPEVGLVFGKHDCRKYLKRAAREAGLPDEKAAHLSPYDFRHGRITLWAERAPNLPGIGYLAGHKHATTTERYVHNNRRAAEEVLALSVRALSHRNAAAAVPAIYRNSGIVPLPLRIAANSAKEGSRTPTGISPQEPEGSARDDRVARVAAALGRTLATWLEHGDVRGLRLALLDVWRELEVSSGNE